ncbi:putative cupredoxin-like copper-binding protein [Limnobacter thiooxidans]|uniref:Cupredoxin family protein n=2 Tax=Limnobacter TaxID=131079 RepID=A0AA86JI14_9BURK|nr:putative cupredoxin-like copper-binding protein [Limnobacter thiooxidans]BET27501.1 cupredoxin family protein [Limnobacter thiooxidans]
MLKFSGIVLACVALMGYMGNIAFAHGEKKGNTAPVVKEQTAWGIAGHASKVVRTIDVSMGDDMRFKPGRMEVREGETIRFVVRNTGALLHEFVIGTPAENARHAELMLKFPGMEHDEPYMAHVAPGKAGEIVWLFNKAGEFEFACLMAGHFQAGMVGTITVTAK